MIKLRPRLDPIQPLSLRFSVLLAALSGVLYFAAFPGVGLWPLAGIALVPLLIGARNHTPRAAFLIGLVSGTTTACAGFWWLLEMLTRYSGFPLPLCVLFLLLLSTWQGARMGIATWLAARSERKGWPPEASFVACFVASEALFPLLFPWYFGCALQPVPVLIQGADLGGPMLLSASLAVVNVAIARTAINVSLRKPLPRITLAAAGAVMALSAAYGWLRIRQVDAAAREAPALAIGLVQGNIPMDIQGRAAYRDAFDRQVRASHDLVRRGAQLVVWSESAFLYQVPEADAERFVADSFARALGAPTLVGALLYREQAGPTRTFNSALFFDRSAQLRGRYDKHHLLAFGEYIPLGETFPILYKWSPESGHVTPGDRFENVSLDGHSIAILICYEDILPGFVNTAVKSTQPELLIDITNDAWFGQTAEPELHLALSQLRAVEQRRYLARAANTGVSAIVDPVGRLTARTATFSEGALLGEVRWMKGKTLYQWLGDFPWYLVSFMAVLSAFWSRPGRRTPRPESREPGKRGSEATPEHL
ncbi:MAG: apolipoprotein N-acyltransferase [Deltaproteobacteria bacterium]|nr:apolipoprotein N-acyltransferase [Deltaproteobacteria bacterium]